jgi:hypothetical protein
MERKLNFTLNTKKHMSHKLIIIFSLALALLFSVPSCHDGFPNKAAIDGFFDDYRSERSNEKRIELLGSFMEKLRYPSTTSDDYNLKYAMDRLAKLYRETSDESILVTIDNTRIQDVFANFVCDFYAAIKNERGFKRRYFSQNASRKAIERCVGISFSQEEIEALTRSMKQTSQVP